jgi:hypothetical protein
VPAALISVPSWTTLRLSRPVKGADLGIAEIELCRFERGLIDGERRLGLVQGACVLVECIPRHPPILDQDRVAAVVRSRILERSLISLYLSLRLVEGRLVVARIDAIDEIAGLDVGTIAGRLHGEIARHFRLQGHGPNRFGHPDVVEIEGYGLLHHRDGGDRQRRGGFGRCWRRICASAILAGAEREE